MTTGAYKRDMRINSLYNKALNGKYTNGGKFSMIQLINDASAIGVHLNTAEDYAAAVVERLKKAGHLH